MHFLYIEVSAMHPNAKSWLQAFLDLTQSSKVQRHTVKLACQLLVELESQTHGSFMLHALWGNGEQQGSIMNQDPTLTETGVQNHNRL